MAPAQRSSVPASLVRVWHHRRARRVVDRCVLRDKRRALFAVVHALHAIASLQAERTLEKKMNGHRRRQPPPQGATQTSMRMSKGHANTGGKEHNVTPRLCR